MKLDIEANDFPEPVSNLYPAISIDLTPPDVKLDALHKEVLDLSYTCLVIPWHPEHELQGDIKGTLPGWIQQVCISSEWRLEFVTVNPQFLQWGIIVPRNMVPAEFMSVFRKETSEKITTTFPLMKREDLEHNFWAPGYLVINGIRPHPQELIRQFIQSVRRQQGQI